MKEKTIKRPLILICIILVLANLGTAFSQTMRLAKNVPNQEKNKSTKTIAVISDVHYMDPSLLINDGLAFQTYLAGDRKLLKESVAITKAIIDSLIALKPQILLIPGDLTKDGEKVSHTQLASLLQKLVDNGTKVLVVPGNHDVNNPHALAYDGETSARVTTVSASEFASIYQNMGYGDAIARDANSLSYVAEPVSGLRILAIDAAKYDSNDFERNRCVTSGAIKAESLAWMKTQIADAKKQGKQIFAMMHHGINEHYQGQSVVFGEYVVDNYIEVGNTLMDAGLQVVFTGHYHANDIVKRERNANILLDIETGSTVTWPCPYRYIQYSDDSVLNIETRRIKHIDYAIPDDIDFDVYAKTFVLEGIKNLANSMLPSMGIPSETPGFSMIVDFITETFAAHYAGDETINSTQQATLEVLMASIANMPPTTQALFGIVANMWNDPKPSDNTLRFNLPNFVQETAYWIQDDFTQDNFINSILQNSSYILTVENIPTLPNNINLTTYYANNEVTTSACAGNSVRIRAESDGGYAQFEVPNAGFVELYVKAKGNAASPRTAKVYRDDVLVAVLEGIHTDSCARFTETLNSTVPVTYKVMSGCENPIMLSSIVVSKCGGGEGEIVKRPSIKLSTNSTALLNPPYVSGVIGDPTDPASTIGVNFVVKASQENIPFTVHAISDNPAVLANEHILLTGTDSVRNVKIIPHSVGYAKIYVKLLQENDSAIYQIHYAASDSSTDRMNTIWHTAIADASTALEINDSLFVVADDETNILRMYNRNQSGLHVYTFDASAIAQVSSSDPEMDIEASMRGVLYPSRLYWMASLGNNKSGKLRPNRNRVFSTDIVDNNDSIVLRGANTFDSLREKMIIWGDAQAWNFTASTAVGMIPKRIDGFNVEGLAVAPDNTTAYVGLRAPLVPEQGKELTDENRCLAVIVPIENFEEAMNSNNMHTIVLGKPITMNLGGRSIRSIEKISTNQYVIVAGMFDDQNRAALYLWSGEANDKPELLDTNLFAQGEIHPEGILYGEVQNNRLNVELVSDNGTADYYNDGTEAKSLPLNYKKFRKDKITLFLCEESIVNDTIHIQSAQLPYSIYDTVLTQAGNYTFYFQTQSGCDSIVHLTLIVSTSIEKNKEGMNLKLIPNPASSILVIETTENFAPTQLIITDLQAKIVYRKDNSRLNRHEIDVTNFVKGVYFVRVSCGDVSKVAKLLVQ